MLKLSLSRVALVLLVVSFVILIVAWESSAVPHHVQGECTYNWETGEKDCPSYNTFFYVPWQVLKFIDDHNGLMTAIATAFIALFTVALTRVGREQARDNRITEQAYVFPLAPQHQFLMLENQTIIGLRLWVPWKNSGGTPAVPVNSLVGATWVANENDFQFGTVVQQGQKQPFVLGPDAEIPSGTIDIGAPHINDLLIHRQGHQFFWGWARYKDVFPNSPWHVVEFCFRVTVEGQLGPPPFTGRVNFVFYGEHNRYYDEK